MLTALTPPPFRVEPAGVRWLRPGLRKYSCQLTIDTNTVHRNFKLSDNNRMVARVEEVQSYSNHPERFDYWPQLLCRNGLTGRCYWEVEWRGRAYISVSYRRIGRKGNSDDCVEGLISPGVCTALMMVLVLSGTITEKHPSPPPPPPPPPPPLSLTEQQCMWTVLLALCPSTESPLTL
ncbi:neoverrucotoxin subunit beta-like [Oreochromis niloticus]|uniref:neoverrucotoxin subunit beta-like n=1 Tax=Oreochromis niloticus TaxID=8128 RepID=UPI000DF1DB62|nr:neoverrucotoxin subunit beta-like [Oreochromis niloticus]